MSHCTPEQMEDLKQLLTLVRELKALKEKSFACFYFKGKGVLHFHLNKGKPRFAHVWSGKDWHEILLPQGLTILEQKKLFLKIEKLLSL